MMRFGAAFFSGVLAASFASVGCLFPDYAFDAPEPTGGAGATGGTAGDGAGGNVGGSAGAGGAGAGPVEDCMNGRDDDDDGAVDCADPDCEPGFECAPPVPGGWTDLGYLALFQGASAALPECPNGAAIAYEGGDDLDPGASACTACGCASATGQSCELTQDLDPAKPGIQPIQVSNMPCGQPATVLSTMSVPDPPWGGGCYHGDPQPGGQTCAGEPCNRALIAAVPSVAGGSCDPTGGEPAFGTPTFDVTARACAVPSGGGGCSGGAQCVPRPAAPFEARVCVGRAGDQTCPDGDFSERFVFFEGVEDERACSGCSCGAVSGGSCEMTLTAYGDASVGTCNNPVDSVASGTCTDLSGNPGLYGLRASVTMIPAGGTCPVTGGGIPSGDVLPSTPSTFCCLP
jgi:hypothetical protein